MVLISTDLHPGTQVLYKQISLLPQLSYGLELASVGTWLIRLLKFCPYLFLLLLFISGRSCDMSVIPDPVHLTLLLIQGQQGPTISVPKDAKYNLENKAEDQRALKISKCIITCTTRISKTAYSLQVITEVIAKFGKRFRTNTNNCRRNYQFKSDSGKSASFQQFRWLSNHFGIKWFMHCGREVETGGPQHEDQRRNELHTSFLGNKTSHIFLTLSEPDSSVI